MLRVRAKPTAAGPSAPDAIGPTPFLRAVIGVLLGVAAGITAALLLPRTSSERADIGAV